MKKVTIYSNEDNLYISRYKYDELYYTVLVKDYDLATDFKNYGLLKYWFIWRFNKKYNLKFRIRNFEFLSWHIEDNLQWNMNNWWKNIILIWNEIKHEFKKEMKRIKNEQTN